MTSTTAASTRQQQEQLEECLLQLQQHESSSQYQDVLELVASFQSSSSDNNNNNNNNNHQIVDPTLLERYQSLKHDYVLRKTQHALLQHVAQYGMDNDFGVSKMMETLPTPQEQQQEVEELQVRQNQLQDQVQSALQELQTKVQHLQIQHATLQLHKDELQQRLHEYQTTSSSSSNINASTDHDMDRMTEEEEEEEDVTEDQLHSEGERLTALQWRKAELLQKLQHAKQEHLTLTKELRHEQSKLPPELVVSSSSSSSSQSSPTKSTQQPQPQVDVTQLQALQKHNAQLQQSVHQHRTMEGFYNGMRVCLEELHGVQIINVSYRTENDNNNNNNNTTTKNDATATTLVGVDENRNHHHNTTSNPTILVCEFLLLEQYEFVVELLDDVPSSRRTTTATTASSILDVTSSSAIPSAPAPTTSTAQIHKVYFRKVHDVSMDDVVQAIVSRKLWLGRSSSSSSTKSTTADGVRWILTEALARLQIRMQRHQQWEQMQRMQVVVRTATTTTTDESHSSTTVPLQILMRRASTTPSEDPDHLNGDQLVECRFPIPSPSNIQNDGGDNATMVSAMLRLTPDCPLVPGSVYLDHLILVKGLTVSQSRMDDENDTTKDSIDDGKKNTGWTDDATLQSIQNKINAQVSQFRFPTELLHCVAHELDATLLEQPRVVGAGETRE